MIGQMSIIGGQQSFMMNYFRHLDKGLFHVDFLGVHGNSSPYAEEIQRLGGQLYYWNDLFGLKTLLKSVCKLVKFIKRGNYDVVHSNIYLGNCWFLVAARLAGVKVRISHSHCTFPLVEPTDNLFMSFYHSKIQKFLLLKSATKLLSCGEAAGVALYGDCEFEVMNNSIDVNEFTSCSADTIEALKEEFNIANEKVFASISRFDNNKNLKFAIEIFDNVHKKDENTMLIIGGAEPYDGSTHTEISSLVRQRGLEKSVRIVGAREDLRNIMHIVDCWLFPSLKEGLPIVGIELQAASVPIIASDTITKEMDMGLDLIKYISLKDKDEWVSEACSLTKHNIPKKVIEEAYSKRNYNIKDSVKRLESLYKV